MKQTTIQYTHLHGVDFSDYAEIEDEDEWSVNT